MKKTKQVWIVCPTCGQLLDAIDQSQVSEHMHGKMTGQKSKSAKKATKAKSLEEAIRSINLTSPHLMYDCEYHIWRGGEYKGTVTWTKDKNTGDSFQSLIVDENGELRTLVWSADKWMLKTD